MARTLSQLQVALGVRIAGQLNATTQPRFTGTGAGDSDAGENQGNADCKGDTAFGHGQNLPYDVE
jgi:hypothetical protein